MSPEAGAEYGYLGPAGTFTEAALLQVLPEGAVVPGEPTEESDIGDDEPEPDEPENGAHGEQIASKRVPDEETDARPQG